MSRSGNTPVRSRLTFWATPAFCLLAGVAYLVAAWSAGEPRLGVVLLGIMLVFGAGIVLASRYSETVRGLLDRRDERISGIDLRATAAAGVALILCVIGGAVVELARGRSGAPYTWMALVTAVVYIAALVVQRVRR
jgi:hypothetical protein